MSQAVLNTLSRIQSGTVADALQYIESSLRAGQLLSKGSDRGTLRSEARAVLKIAADISDSDMFGHVEKTLDAQCWQRLQSIVRRRCSGEPMAYIEGRRGFHAIELQVDANVLVPRPETELIVDAVLEHAPTSGFSVLDSGTGSGAIALALANARVDAEIAGLDVSPAALCVALANGRALGLEVEWLESDWFDAVAGRRFDFICCNPPYIRTRDPHLDDLHFEPLLALDGGADGLDSIRQVLAAGPAHLNPRGRLLLEHGYDQAAEVSRIATAAGLQQTDTLRDLAGHERVSIFQWSQ